ncbi:ATPase, T2SS/T4P/T4SS family [Bacillus safensis]|uniref:Bacterial type II secretion system protein E domain-containing protein n=1 Tax=Bacillus safensis TaxID=561879 RepID=A0A1L6ZP72_BACIA|nr:ATPase, T2SS/T4P/T4SS family [Bacillus safensis]APT48317.1 hypothetical protein BSA145_20855 [Bacillus safensis]
MTNTTVRKELLEKISNDIKKTNPTLYLAAFTDDSERRVLKQLIQKEFGHVLNTEERLDEVVQELVGLGVIDEILKKEKNVTDIQYTHGELIVSTSHKLPYVYTYELEDSYIEGVIAKFAHAKRKEFSPKKWKLNTQLGNLRINAVHASKNSYNRPTMSLRVTEPKLILNKENFEKFAPMYIYDLLDALIKSNNSFILSGKTGAGKTELQKLLFGFIKDYEFIIAIEDEVAEGHYKTLYPEKYIMSWLASNDKELLELIDEGLRNNPDWLTITEIRRVGAMALYTALQTGHQIISSIHSKTAFKNVERFLNMLKTSGENIDEAVYLQELNEYLNIGAYVEKKIMPDGTNVRYLKELVEYKEDGEHILLFSQSVNEDGTREVRCYPYSQEIQRKINDTVGLNYEMAYIKEWERDQKNGTQKEAIYS